MKLLERLLYGKRRLRAGEVYDGPKARFHERERVRWPGMYAVDEVGEPVALLEWDQPDPKDAASGRWVVA